MIRYASCKKRKTAVLIGVCILAVFSVTLSKFYTKSIQAQTAPTLLAATNEQRTAFLKNNGVEVEDEPYYVCDIIIPSSFDGIYEQFESVQNAQGLSLSEYKGKKVRRFSYLVKNSSGGSQKTSADILVYEGRIVACALCNLTSDGGFEKIIG